jgi:signal transduction histidine kinase
MAAMKSLYLRIWLTVIAALALFAVASGWLFQRHVVAERERSDWQQNSRIEALADLLERSLPPASQTAQEQEQALRDWSQRLRLPMALDDAQGRRIAASQSFVRREQSGLAAQSRSQPVKLDDGRTLWLARPLALRPPPGEAGAAARSGSALPSRMWGNWPLLPGLSEGAGLVALVTLLFVAVGAGVYPVVRRLTRRLEELKHGVEAFGAGALDQRVKVEGHDEVAAVAGSFNEAAARVESLLRSNQSLLANASHELRSPLARLKMAVSMMDSAQGPQREQLQREVHDNIRELDALVEEVLLSSRLDATRDGFRAEPVDLLVLAAEEAAKIQTQVHGDATLKPISGDERLLRRAIRNLLENARRYGGASVDVSLLAQADRIELHVCDRGSGVPAAFRERIFEAFFRLPGHAEREGGVGLGLALVRQIAQRHGGSVRCDERPGGGSCFVLSLPTSV